MKMATTPDRRKKVLDKVNELTYDQDEIISQHNTRAQHIDLQYQCGTERDHDEKGNNICCEVHSTELGKVDYRNKIPLASANYVKLIELAEEGAGKELHDSYVTIEML